MFTDQKDCGHTSIKQRYRKKHRDWMLSILVMFDWFRQEAIIVSGQRTKFRLKFYYY